MRDGISAFKAAEDRARQQREREERDRRRREDEDRAALEAAALEAAGDHALAASIVEEALAAPAPVVVLPDTTAGVEGLTFRRRWLWRPQNAALVPREFLCLDEKKIGAYVRAMKGSGAIPGLEIYCVDDPVR
jgi:cation transport ATPase